ncbi:MAG: TonB-dependent receptor [Bryobacteraceae bacterium]|nr:TonB-dependent receptor [Bryobacteraceae bacterium]
MRLALALLVSSLALHAQTFRGAISGVVTDSSGAAIAGAAVKAELAAQGLSRTTTSSSSGDFAFPDLPLGLYTVTVSMDGFQGQKMDKVEVAVSKTTNLTFSLPVAQQVSVVEVSATAVALETSSTALVGVVGPKLVEDLPMNGRDFRQMLKLSPGVSPSSNSVNGMRTSGNNYQIDGADNNDAFHNTSAVNQGGVSGIAGTLLPVEAIDQFSVVTNGSAELGRNGGSNVNLVIKSGTNQFHGSAYYFNRNEYFAALTPFQVEGSKKRKMRNDQWGFSLGGPIIRNKTFFFLTGESQEAIAANSLRNTHPSDAWVADATRILNQFNVPVNPVSRNLLSFWPARGRALPATANNYLSADQNDYDSQNGIVKVDHQLTSKHNLSGRYFGGTGEQAADIGIPYREFFQIAPSRMHNVSLVLNSTLTPTLVNQLTLGANFFKQTFNDVDTGYDPIGAGLNTGVTEDSLRGAPFLRISGFAGVGGTQPLGRIDTTGHITNNLSWTRGRHQLKFGGEYRRAHLDVFYDTDKRGRFTFDGSRGPWATTAGLSTAQRALADFLAGYTAPAGAIIVRGTLQRDYRQNSFDWWIHDNFQVTPKLNLNFGVRYSFHGVLNDTENSITNFIPGRGFVTPGVDVDSLYPNDLNNFAPRFGFAFTPKRGGSTVIRGSWGLFYDMPPLNFIVANTGMPNGGSAGVHANPGGPSPVFSISLDPITIQQGVPIFGTANPRPPFGAFSISQDFRIPYVQNYNLNIQQGLGKATVLQVGYVGSAGRHLSLIRNINFANPGAGTVQSRRPFNTQYPTLAAINELNSIGNSHYNSLQASVRTTRWKNITLNANYTYGKAIDNGSNVRNALPADSNNLGRERGPANFDIRHIFTAFASYDVPNFIQKYPRLGRGWQVNTLMTFHGGEPIDLRAGTNVSGTGEGSGLDRVDVVGDPFANVAARSAPGAALPYFNPAAFARPAAGTFGNIGRNALYGPGFAAVDFSVFKTTSITERVSAQFRVEIFNITNRANYANPGTSLAASTAFGLITNTRNGGNAPGIGFGEPRNVQLALRIMF